MCGCGYNIKIHSGVGVVKRCGCGQEVWMWSRGVGVVKMCGCGRSHGVWCAYIIIVASL